MSNNNWLFSLIIVIALIVGAFYLGKSQRETAIDNVLTDTSTIYIASKPDTVYKGYKTEFKIKYITKYVTVDSSKKPFTVYDLFSDTSFVSGKDTIQVFNVINSTDKNAKLTTDFIHKDIETFIHDTTITKIKIPVYIEKELAFYETQYFVIVLGAIVYLASLLF